MKPMIIYLVRHGQKDKKITQFNKDKIGLTETGKKQAKAFAQYAKKLDVKKIYVSPYLRTKETAKPIEEELNLQAEECEIIAEVGVKKYLDLISHYTSKKKIKEFEENFINQIKNLGKKENPILLVTHSGYLRMLKAVLTQTNGNIAKKIDLLFAPMHNLGMTKIVIENNNVRIEEFDNTEFLPENLKNKFPY